VTCLALSILLVDSRPARWTSNRASRVPDALAGFLAELEDSQLPIFSSQTADGTSHESSSMIKSILSIIVILIASTSNSFADPVSYFRQHSGVASSKGLPSDLTAAQPRWISPLNPGNSTPCIFGDAIYLTTWDEEKKELATVSIDRSTGDVNWKQVAPTQTVEQFHRVGSPASCSVACDGERVFAFFGSYGMLCYDLAGKKLWDHPMGPFQDEFGASSSPILVNGKLILNSDHDLDNFLVGLDAKTGQQLWKTNRNDFTRSYSTPVVWNVNGQNQVVVAGSLKLVAYDPSNGKPIWWINGLSRIVDTTPVVRGDRLFVATWTPGGDPSERIGMESFDEALKAYDKNDDKEVGKDELPKGSPVTPRFFRIDLNQNEKLDQEEWNAHARVFKLAQNVAMAVKAGGRGDVTETHVEWVQRKSLPTVPSPLVYRDEFYMIKDGGIMTALDVANGEILKQGRLEGRGNYYASPVAGDGLIYTASEQGVVTIVKAGANWDVLSSHDFKQRIMATPVISRGRFFIRTDAALYCY
jgi:outer membrane protein assembly factor BamB